MSLLSGFSSLPRFLFVKLLVLAACAQAFVPPALSPAARWTFLDAQQRGVGGVCPATSASFVSSLRLRPAMSPAFTRPGLGGGVLGIRAQQQGGGAGGVSGDRGLGVDYERSAGGAKKTAETALGVDYERAGGGKNERAQGAKTAGVDYERVEGGKTAGVDYARAEGGKMQGRFFVPLRDDYQKPEYHLKGVKKHKQTGIYKGRAEAEAQKIAAAAQWGGGDAQRFGSSSGVTPGTSGGVKPGKPGVKRQGGTSARNKRKWEDEAETSATGKKPERIKSPGELLREADPRRYACPTCEEKLLRWIPMRAHLKAEQHVRLGSYKSFDQMRPFLRVATVDSCLEEGLKNWFTRLEVPGGLANVPPPEGFYAAEEKELAKRDADGKLIPNPMDPRVYVCPTCDHRERKWMEMRDHMKKQKHLQIGSFEMYETLRPTLRVDTKESPLPEALKSKHAVPPIDPVAVALAKKNRFRTGPPR